MTEAAVNQKSDMPGRPTGFEERQAPSIGAPLVVRTTETDILQSLEQMQARVVGLLGGAAVIGRPVGTDALDAHFLLEAGIPNQAVDHLAHSLKVMGQESLEQAIGISLRTLQRKEKKPQELLSQEQAGRTWQFAGLLAKATVVFGTQDEAERWFERPAIGLNQKRPIDLLTTPAGIKVIEDHLERLAYGVYA
jgi:putative toxin-antitoxin system antitoxin component (TIGR02293 family)